MKTVSNFRQLLFPKIFRIPPSDAYLPSSLVDAFLVVASTRPSPTAPTTSATGLTLKEQERVVVGVATELWRLRTKLTKEGTDEPREEARRLFRHVASAWDVLSEAGVAIQHHTGQPFRSGLAVEVIAFQPTDGLSRETIIETVRPSIYFNGRPVQQGQIIVGTPVETR